MKSLFIFIFFWWNVGLILESYATSAPFLIHSRIDKFFLNPDGTGTQQLTMDIKILTPEGINLLTPFKVSYDPDLKELHVEEAYVLQPDGSKTILSSDAIFTRPSPASEEAPGFVHTLTTSLVFPNLQVGSRIFCTLKGQLKKQGPFGFTWKQAPDFFIPQEKYVFELHVPLQKDFPLYVAQKGNLYTIKDTEDLSKKKRLIRVSFENWKEHEAEPGMVSPNSWLPYFVITSLKTWEDLASIYYKENDSQSIANDTIKNLAKIIVGTKKGKEAARALYDWVAQNITYLSISLDPLSGIKSHTSLETLQAKYGDCKDQVTLLQALLKTEGIPSIPTLVSLNGGFRDFPILPVPFFDHIILYLPTYRLFADPTNRFASFGTLSPTLYQTPALFVQKNSTREILPPLDPNNHLYKVTTALSFSKEGTLEGNNKIDTTGYAAADYRAFFFKPATPPQKIANEVLSMTPEGGAGTIDAQDMYALSPIFTFSGKWHTPKLLTLEENSSFLIPYGLDPRLSLPFLRNLFTNTPRKYPFEMIPGIDTWEYTITPPNGYVFSHIPKNRFLETKGGSYKSTYTIDNNKLHVTRQLEIKRSFFLPQESSQIMDPVELFLLDLRQPVFIKKQESL